MQRNDEKSTDQRKCITIDDYVFMRRNIAFNRASNLSDKKSFNGDENIIKLATLDSSSLTHEDKISELTPTSSFSIDSENEVLQSTKITDRTQADLGRSSRIINTMNSDEEKSKNNLPHEIFLGQENYLNSFVEQPQTLTQISKDTTIRQSKKPNQTLELTHRPSFARNFPIINQQKVIHTQKNPQLKITNQLSDQQLLRRSSQNDILAQDNLLVRKKRSSSEEFHSFRTTIALREFIEEDLKFSNDLDIFVRVSRPDFGKIYVVRKLEDNESLKEFCKNDISKRSKLFKLQNTHVKKLPLDALKRFCGVKHESNLVELKLSHISEGTFTIQKLDQVSGFSQFIAMDINVVRSSSNILNFKVLKK